MDELISCIIPTWDRAERVVKALQSILEQDYTHREILVVDDGSTDSTAEAIKPFTSPIVHYLWQEHSGVSAARNHGIREAHGEWLAFLDSDDLWHPAKLSRQIHFMHQHPEFLISQTEEIWIRHGKRVNPMNKHRKYGGWIFPQCLPRCIVTPSATLIHRKLFETIGQFDESLPACEDYDLWLRIACRYPIGLLPDALVTKYGGHDDQLSRTETYLDRYRIQALENLLRSDVLSWEQYKLALEELKTKCRIYGEGCLKRGKTEEGNRYLSLPESYATAPE